MSGIESAELASPEAALRGLVLLVGGLALTPLLLVVARRVHPGRKVFFARWRFAHVLAVLGVGLFSGWTWAGLADGVDWTGSSVVKGLVVTVLALSTAAVPVLLFAAHLDPKGVQSLGLWRGGHARALALGLLCYALFLPALTGLELLWPFVLTRMGGVFAPQAVAEGIAELHGGELLFALMLGVLVVPCLEELLFRAFLQPLLVQNLGDRGGVAVTAFLFALLHGESAFLPIFALALLIGAVMLRTQRLSAAIAMHALHNGLMLAVLLAGHENGGTP